MCHYVIGQLKIKDKTIFIHIVTHRCLCKKIIYIVLLFIKIIQNFMETKELIVGILCDLFHSFGLKG